MCGKAASVCINWCIDYRHLCRTTTTMLLISPFCEMNLFSHEWVQWVQYDNGTMAHQAVGMEPLLEHAVSMEIEGAADQLYRMAHDQGAY